MRTRAIVNPSSSHGRLGRAWPEVHAKLEAAIGPVEVAFTDAPMAATRLTREALRDGVDLVIACGGDGTNNEVVNGFFAPPTPGEPDVALRPEAAFSVLMLGTGGDFRKTFGAGPDADAQVRAIAEGVTRPLDVGRLEYVADDGAPAARYFINIASFGMSGMIDREVNRARVTKRIGGSFAYFTATVRAMFGYKPTPVVLKVDEGPEETLVVNMAAACNGQYFGGGMRVGPTADPSDGILDVVVVHDLRLVGFLRGLKKIYAGRHLGSPEIKHIRGRRLVATSQPGAEVLLDVDGEAPGRLPATFTILPGALRFRYAQGGSS